MLVTATCIQRLDTSGLNFYSDHYQYYCAIIHVFFNTLILTINTW